MNPDGGSYFLNEKYDAGTYVPDIVVSSIPVALDWLLWQSTINGPANPGDQFSARLVLTLTRSGKAKIVYFNSKFAEFETDPLSQTAEIIIWGPTFYSNALAGRTYELRMYLVESGEPFTTSYEVIGSVMVPAGNTTSNESGTNP